MQSSDENESIIIVFDENQQETEASFETHGEIIFADTVSETPNKVPIAIENHQQIQNSMGNFEDDVTLTGEQAIQWIANNYDT